MPTATIIAQYVNPPGQGKKLGTIKTPDGTYYGIEPHWVSQFTQGSTYDIEYTSRQFNGKTFHNIKKFVMSQAAPAQSNSGAASGNNTYRQTSNVDAERMFCCGALNAAIQGGQVELKTEALAGAVNILRDVWTLTFGNPKPQAQQSPTKRNDLDDEIPF